MQVLDRGREHLALFRAELAREVPPSVEPDVANPEALLHGFHQRQHAADVVRIDVRQHEQFELPVASG
jgi:hypothetical protein